MNAETLALPWHVTIDTGGMAAIFDVDGRLVAEFVDPHVADMIVKVFNAIHGVSPYI
jgi:hypothetical protein